MRPKRTMIIDHADVFGYNTIDIILSDILSNLDDKVEEVEDIDYILVS